jgi:hypothetical protein
MQELQRLRALQSRWHLRRLQAEEVKNFEVVAFAPHIANREGSGDAAKQLQQLIDSMAAQGWEFHSVQHVTTYVKPGCLGSLLGHSSVPITTQFAIFSAG